MNMEIHSDRNLIIREKDTYISQLESHIPPEVFIEKKQHLLISLHIDVRRDVKYLSMTYKILLYHCAAAL